MNNTNFRIMEIVTKKCNNIFMKDSILPRCKKFIVDNYHVGYISPNVSKYLMDFPNVFQLIRDNNNDEYFQLHHSLQTFEDRTKAVDQVFRILKELDEIEGLKCWRDEMYGVYIFNRARALLKVERAVSCLLGTMKFGVHINGYTVDSEGNNNYMWIGQRSTTKLTYPGLLDNMVGGGLNFDYSVRECAIKECEEEASIPQHLLAKLKPAGTLSLFFEDHRGLNPEVMYCYDLVLPESFIPVNSDGEVNGFLKVPCNELKQLVVDERFKPTSAIVLIDFLIRHGYISPDEDTNYTAYGYWMHSKLPFD